MSVLKSNGGVKMKWFKHLMCRLFGHKWEIYEYRTGYYPTDIEMAEYCIRCGFDTHEN